MRPLPKPTFTPMYYIGKIVSVHPMREDSEGKMEEVTDGTDPDFYSVAIQEDDYPLLHLASFGSDIDAEVCKDAIVDAIAYFLDNRNLVRDVESQFDGTKGTYYDTDHYFDRCDVRVDGADLRFQFWAGDKKDEEGERVIPNFRQYNSDEEAINSLGLAEDEDWGGNFDDAVRDVYQHFKTVKEGQT